MKTSTQRLSVLLATVLLYACGGSAVYVQESFDHDSPFRMRADGDAALVCESARRALLGQGYLIEQASGEGLKARKAIKREDQPNTFIEMHVACLPEPVGSTLFATGLLSTYALKKSSSSASVGLSAVGSISLPIGQSADSLVKVSEETIDDKEFYSRFFGAVGSIQQEMQSAAEAAARAEAAPATGPASPTAASTAPPAAVTPVEPAAPPVETAAPAGEPATAPGEAGAHAASEVPAELEPTRTDAYLLPQAVPAPGSPEGPLATPGRPAPRDNTY